MLKSKLKNFKFLPIFFNKFPLVSNKTIRPYFGTNYFSKKGGPNVRISRMKLSFGNFFIKPNIIYISSSWGKDLFAKAVLQKKKGSKLIFNQNGFYYPGWYKGNWKKQNQDIIDCQKKCDYVIFQSKFCLNTQEKLTGWLPKRYEVLHNSVPHTAQENKRSSGKIYYALSGTFYPHSNHILLPAIQSLKKIIQLKNKESPVLKIIGDFTPTTKKTNWYKKFIGDSLDLVENRNLIFEPSYDFWNLDKAFKNISFALHLTYKDACPNAVLERMSFGIPHIYSNSGGTPELIEDAGLPLEVVNSWNKKISVEVDDLVHAIIKMMDNLQYYQNNTYSRIMNNFNWDNYINRHIEIFNKVLNN